MNSFFLITWAAYYFIIIILCLEGKKKNNFFFNYSGSIDIVSKSQSICFLLIQSFESWQNLNFYNFIQSIYLLKEHFQLKEKNSNSLSSKEQGGFFYLRLTQSI